MGLESVSASEDVIGDLPSPWATNSLLWLVANQDKGDEKVGGQVGGFRVSIRVFKGLRGEEMGFQRRKKQG